MSVKTKDRHLSRSECLNDSRKLVQQILILARPAISNEDGSFVKAGILGSGQAFQMFGNDMFNCAKRIHGNCYQAVDIYIKTQEDLDKRNQYFKTALEYCDSIMRLLDLCIFLYAKKNKRKMRSFSYVAKLTKEVKTSIYERINLDNMILQNIQEKKNGGSLERRPDFDRGCSTALLGLACSYQ